MKGFIKLSVLVGVVVAFIAGVALFNHVQNVQATYHGYKWVKTDETPCKPECGQTDSTHEVTYTCVDMPGNDKDECKFTLSCLESWNLVNGRCYKWYNGHLHSKDATKTPETKVVEEKCSIPQEEVKACEPQPCDNLDVREAVEDQVEVPCETPTPTPTPEADHNAPGTNSICTTGATTQLPANVFVTRDGTHATVNGFVTEGDSVNIYWKETSQSGWPYSSAGTNPDGVRPNADHFVSYTVNELKAGVDYDFAFEQKFGCGAGEKFNLKAVVHDADDYTKVFRVTRYEVSK